MSTTPTDDKNRHWLTRRSTIRRLIVIGLVVLAVATALDAVIPGHPFFAFDGRFGFYSAFGFASCAVMVIFAKVLGWFVKRKDTYYNE